MRGRDIKNIVIDSNSIAAVGRTHPEINYRHVVNQSKKATGTNELNFSNKVTGPLQETGKKDARSALGLPELSAKTNDYPASFNNF